MLNYLLLISFYGGGDVGSVMKIITGIEASPMIGLLATLLISFVLCNPSTTQLLTYTLCFLLPAFPYSFLEYPLVTLMSRIFSSTFTTLNLATYSFSKISLLY